MEQTAQSGRGKTVFGFPLEGFSLFQSLLLAVASAFLTFFATTCVAIFALLGMERAGRPCGELRRHVPLCRISRGRAGAGGGAAVLVGVVGAGEDEKVSGPTADRFRRRSIRRTKVIACFAARGRRAWGFCDRIWRPGLCGRGRVWTGSRCPRSWDRSRTRRGRGARRRDGRDGCCASPRRR
jgi:hypothetical protein